MGPRVGEDVIVSWVPGMERVVRLEELGKADIHAG